MSNLSPGFLFGWLIIISIVTGGHMTLIWVSVTEHPFRPKKSAVFGFIISLLALAITAGELWSRIVQ